MAAPQVLPLRDRAPRSLQGDAQSPSPVASASTTSGRAWLHRLRSYASLVAHHAARHTGVGIVCAVAYFDPGNWGVDLQAGSQFGYKLLFVVLLAGIFAVFFQTQASRLGCVTGLDLASHCRLLLYDRPKHKLLWRWLALYPLYALSEIAIISTDLAELLGSAIALCLLFPSLPLWAGVVITASDVLLLLAVRDPVGGQPVRVFEVFIGVLVFIVLICMAVIISKASVVWADAFDGFLPSKTLFQSGALYTSIGIIGATVMPHSLFLGSALATQDRVSQSPATPPSPKEPELLRSVDSTLSSDSDVTVTSEGDADAHTGPPQRQQRPTLLARVATAARRHLRVFPPGALPEGPRSHADVENKPYAFVRAHLYHGIVDMVISLLGLAVVINSMILILSAAVFFHGAESEDTASLFDAYALLLRTVGKPAAILFALALLASGQSASIVATLAGQIVSEGFIRWRLSPIMRRLLTRCLGLVPALVVAAALGRAGIDTLLVASQVVLSIVLPFVVFPLLWLTSNKKIMAVKRPLPVPTLAPLPSSPSPSSPPDDGDVVRGTQTSVSGEGAEDRERRGDTDADADALEAQFERVDFSDGRVAVVVGWAIWFVIVLANGYAIVGLALGQG